MIVPLHTLDDFVPGPQDATATGWRKVDYDKELGIVSMSVIPAITETVVHYPADPENIDLLIDAETLQIVGIWIEDYDPKALR